MNGIRRCRRPQHHPTSIYETARRRIRFRNCDLNVGTSEEVGKVRYCTFDVDGVKVPQLRIAQVKYTSVEGGVKVHKVDAYLHDSTLNNDLHRPTLRVEDNDKEKKKNRKKKEQKKKRKTKGHPEKVINCRFGYLSPHASTNPIFQNAPL